MTITKIPIFDSVDAAPHAAPGWTPLLVLAAAVTSLGAALPVGFNIGVINTPAIIIKQFCNESVASHYGAELSVGQLDVLWSVVVSLFLVGGMTGSLYGGWAADRFGRKGAIAAAMVASAAAAALLLSSKYANAVEMLLLGRLVVGVASGLTTSVVPMYLTELAPDRLRGALGVFCPMGITIGVLVGQFAGLDWLLGTECCWHLLLALYGPLVLACGVLLPVLPESPKYLYVVLREEARGVRELCRLRRLPEERLGADLSALRMAHKADMETGAPSPTTESEWTAAKVVRSPSLRLPLLLVCAVQAGQQVSGINAVFYYSGSVFRTAGLSATQSQYASLGAGLVNFLVSILAVPLVNGCGRRLLLLLSTVTACLCLVLLGSSIIFIESFSWMPYVAVISLLLYVFCYGLGMGPIPYFIGSELFDVGPRPLGMAIGSLSNWGGNFAVGMCFTAMQSVIGAASFYVFATFTAALAILLHFYFPETKGRDPAEIADMLRLGFKSKVAKTVKHPHTSSPLNKPSDIS